MKTLPAGFSTRSNCRSMCGRMILRSASLSLFGHGSGKKTQISSRELVPMWLSSSTVASERISFTLDRLLSLTLSSAEAMPARWISQPMNWRSGKSFANPCTDSPAPKPISNTVKGSAKGNRLGRSRLTLNFRSTPYWGHSENRALFWFFDMCACRALYQLCESGISFLRFLRLSRFWSSCARASVAPARSPLEVAITICNSPVRCREAGCSATRESAAAPGTQDASMARRLSIAANPIMVGLHVKREATRK
mmetsp:Transcript_18795/g.41875  ORF Transcript_18795/g.41875 Transcript_18795/m.41875 type:complete len:252 (+) Transcript_18795:303-1058(+)